MSTKTFTTQIPMQALAAAFLCMNHKDHRPFCNTIHFYDGQCAATNGHVLLWQRIPEIQDTFSLSYELTKHILKYKKEFSTCEIEGVLIEENDAYQKFDIKATLPNRKSFEAQVIGAAKLAREAVSNVIPHESLFKEITAAAFDPNYLELIGKVGKALDKTTAVIRTRTNKSASVKFTKRVKIEGPGTVVNAEVIADDIHLVVMSCKMPEHQSETASLKEAA